MNPGKSAALSLGAAMRGVNVCKAMPASRNFVLADHVDSTRCQPGALCQINLAGVPNRDSRGRIAHVRGVMIAAQASVTAGATNTAVSAYNFRGLFGSIELTDSTGWKYLDTLDGRTLLDDQYFRTGSRLQYPVLSYGTQGAVVPTQSSDNGLATNAGAGDYEIPCSLYIPFHNPRSGNPSEGLIPLAMIQELGALRFNVQTSLPGAPAGVTFNEFQYVDGTDGAGLDVWLDVVYLDGAVVDAPWQISNYTMTVDSGLLKYPSRETEYLWIRYFPEDTFNATPPINGNGQSLAQSMEGLTLDVAGFQVFGGFRNVDAVLRMRWFTGTDIDGSWLDNNASRDLPVMTSASVPLAMLLLPWRPRGFGAAGGINIKAQSRTPSAFRFVHRTVQCHDGGRAEKIARAIGLKAGCACVGTNAKGESVATIGSTNPIIVY